MAIIEKKVRDQAVASLIEWLKSKGDDISELEMLKLWKGLFYCKLLLSINSSV
jgi:hypothetical protein